MTDIIRYAIYLVPTGDLGVFGASWLGWDIERGHAVPHLAIPGLPRPLTELTAAARPYGFHATVKPPFRLADGTTADGLTAALHALATAQPAFEIAGLTLSDMDGFLALTPTGDPARLTTLAAQVVADLDPFRAPAPPDETARRRAAGLTPRQEALLLGWGYPYVMDEFHAHFTLTGRLSGPDSALVRALIAPHLGPHLGRPFRIDALCLVGEQATGGFRLLDRVPLSGRT